MAGGGADRGLIEVFRSGPLYLVRRGDVGRLVTVDSGRAYPPADVQSILAHSPVSDPWQPVPEADWPAAVRAAADALRRD